MKTLSIIFFVWLIPIIGISKSEYTQYVPFEIEFETEVLSETGNENPFLDYRLQVLFENGKHTFNVPGYFAADGDAANSSASEGKVWKVKFAPPFEGECSYGRCAATHRPAT